MENYKSLDSHVFFRSGFVQTVYHQKTQKGNFVFKADVRPSFRVSVQPHHPWVSTTDEGRVIAGHCDCMAGLGETCSHVGALLYKIEAAVCLGYTAEACTDVPCAWNQNFVAEVQPARVTDINFYRVEAKEKILQKQTPDCANIVSTGSENENQFLNVMSSFSTPPVCLSLFSEYNSKFVCGPSSSVTRTKLPLSLGELYKSEYISSASLEESKKK